MDGLRPALEHAVEIIASYREGLPESWVTPAVSRADVREALDPCPDGPTPLRDVVEELVAAASPGLMAKHYSPRASLFLLTGEPAETRLALRRAVERALAEGRQVGALLVDEDVPLLADLAHHIKVVALGSEADLPAVAGRLFAAMRDLDAAG